ncbi:MAG: hypothetical protein HDS97_05355 [Bacteroidales bacterium]|nr:hypothetical protein [Bacteroidales bacterium]
MKQRYDSYKPSGIDWIGEIPSHWKTAAIKNSFRLYAGATPKTERREYWDGEIIWVTPADYKTDDHYINRGRKNITKDGLASCATEIVPAESLIFSKRAPIGTVGLAKNPLCTNQGCIACVPKSKTVSNYFYYLCRIATKEFEILGSGATFLEISTSNFANFKFPLPPYSEQEAIATWLDEKCSEIDAAIAKVDREIELIDELKHSEISRVVTRGLNPDVPLKQSGIDWIGEVPEHWEILKVKYLVRFSSGDTITSEQFIDTAEYPVYGANGYRGRFDKFNYSGERILIGRVGALCGNVHYTNERIWCSEHALISSKVLGGQEFDYGWLCLLFESMNLNQYGGGSAQPVIASSTIENLSIIFPPLTEQQSIADYLDKKCGEIDGLKEKLVKKRETLKELRQSIISEVVTGKRKVI